MTNKVKLDYNNFMRQIMETISQSEDETTQNMAFGIGIGLELLTSYLKEIATLAIERNDAELLELCKGLLIVKEDDDETDI